MASFYCLLYTTITIIWLEAIQSLIMCTTLPIHLHKEAII